MDKCAAPESLSQCELKLREWISRWYDHAASEGLVRPPFSLDDSMAERLEGYFFAGLTPAEGAQAFFRSVH
ncbi:hypothetical protein VSR69_45235 [Paraburkholderia phytofirmans]